MTGYGPEEDDGWTTVSYGRGRQRHRGRAPQPRGYDGRPNRFTAPADGQRSYASVTRGPRWARTDQNRGENRDYYDQRHERDYDRGEPWHRRARPRYGDSAHRPPRHDRGGQRQWRQERPYYYRDDQRGYQRDRQPYRPDQSRWRPDNSRQRAAAPTRPGERRGAPPARRQTTALSSDPDFTHKVRVLHRIIKGVHHLQNVSGENPPVNIVKMTNTLSDFIKPASPTEQTQSLINANAKNWAFTSTLILKDHYTDMINGEIELLKGFTDSDWHSPFEVAAIWAKRNLGRRLLADTLDSAEALLVARMTQDVHTDPPTDHYPPMCTNTAVNTDNVTTQAHINTTTVKQSKSKVKTQTMATQTVARTQTLARQDDTRSLAAAAVTQEAKEQTEPRGNRVQTAAVIHPPPEQLMTSPMPEATPPSPSGASSAHWVSGDDWSPAGEEESGESEGEDDDDEDSDDVIPPTSPSVQLSPHTCQESQPDPPKEQRTSRLPSRAADQSPPEPTETPRPAAAAAATSSPLQPPASKRPKLLDLTAEEVNVLSDSPASETVTIKTLRRISLIPRKITRAVQKQIEFSSAISEDPPSSLLTPPPPPPRKPTRHMNTSNKLQDWRYKVTGRFLILGDSNTSRFPPHQITDLQIDSFPGATFVHAGALLTKVSAVNSVHTVILSFGLNSREQNPQATVSQLGNTLKVASSRFPLAKIHIPLVNYSRALPTHEQNKLDDLNDYIRNYCNSIPELSRTKFSTEGDKIHWTHSTAANMLSHWRQHVKEQSP